MRCELVVALKAGGENVAGRRSGGKLIFGHAVGLDMTTARSAEAEAGKRQALGNRQELRAKRAGRRAYAGDRAALCRRASGSR